MNCPVKNIKCRAAHCSDRTSHATTMHPVKYETNQNETTEDHPECSMDFKSFQMLPILVYDHKGDPIRTLAFLDHGSDTTIMSEQLFNRLRLPSEPCRLEIGWCTAGSLATDEASRKFNCDIANINGQLQRFTLNDVRTLKELKLPKQAQDPKRLKKLFPFLSDVPIPKYSHQSPQMLIGIQHKNLMTTIKTIQSENCPVVAELTPLGWTVSGSTSGSNQSRFAATCHSNAHRTPGDPKRNILCPHSQRTFKDETQLTLSHQNGNDKSILKSLHRNGIYNSINESTRRNGIYNSTSQRSSHRSHLNHPS
jgi:hypothetical protein